MLNEEKDNTDRATCADEDISMYSLVSEMKSNNGVENDNDLKLGLLIVDGEEGDDDEDNDEEVEEDSVLSIPETVFLPSEIRSMTAVSCVTHELDKSKVQEIKDENHAGSSLWKKWRQPYFVSRWRSVLDSFGPFNTVQILPLLMVLMTLVSVASWRSHTHNIWKNEVLRLREDVQKQKTLLPFTLSLLKEREALLRKQKLLEDAIETAKMNDSKGSNYEHIFPSGESDDDAVLSINNCYVEASLSLGRCSKEWQRWWSDSTDGSTEHGTEEESHDDGFTEDMSKIVKSFTNGLAETTTQSYSFLEKTLKELSDHGIKDASLSRVDYIQSIFQPTPEMTKNDTGE